MSTNDSNWKDELERLAEEAQRSFRHGGRDEPAQSGEPLDELSGEVNQLFRGYADCEAQFSNTGTALALDQSEASAERESEALLAALNAVVQQMKAHNWPEAQQFVEQAAEQVAGMSGKLPGMASSLATYLLKLKQNCELFGENSLKSKFEDVADAFLLAAVASASLHFTLVEHYDCK